MALTGKQKRHLRALAHSLKPVVLTGDAGVSEAVVKKVDVELENHELIKVKIVDDAKAEAPKLAERVGAELAQVIGKTAVLYRRRKEKPEIRLPKD